MVSLAVYACFPEHSRGRRLPEESPERRNEFQRDRDRIIHCQAFRRLEYKTQVFINHEGDLFRTRLTHSIEVAQIARSLARNLQVHTDLVEAISLAHDLGDPHLVMQAKKSLMPVCVNLCRQAGGFEHNLQSLRIVDTLEERYAAFDGLNLCFETREGILKHCNLRHAHLLGDVGERFLMRQQPSLEAQITNLADEIAYNNHDIDDGLRSKLITVEQLCEVPIFFQHFVAARQMYPAVSQKRLVAETIRTMINTLVQDLTLTTQQNLDMARPGSVDELRQAGKMAAFSMEMRVEADHLKRFLRENLYRHPQVLRMMSKARRIIRELFVAYIEDPRLLTAEHRRENPQAQARAIADYIAGMTDRYAIREHQQLFHM